MLVVGERPEGRRENGAYIMKTNSNVFMYVCVSMYVSMCMCTSFFRKLGECEAEEEEDMLLLPMLPLGNF